MAVLSTALIFITLNVTISNYRNQMIECIRSAQIKEEVLEICRAKGDAECDLRDYKWYISKKCI